jgi:hypothetical protein
MDSLFEISDSDEHDSRQLIYKLIQKPDKPIILARSHKAEEGSFLLDGDFPESVRAN